MIILKTSIKLPYQTNKYLINEIDKIKLYCLEAFFVFTLIITMKIEIT